MWQAVRVTPSRWPRLLLLCWLWCQLIVCWYWPDHLPAYANAAALLMVLLMAYQSFLVLVPPSGVLWLHRDGQARWQGDSVSWLPTTTWCWAGFWLRYLDSQGRPRQSWLFIDALSEQDKRRLARQLTQVLNPLQVRQPPPIR